MKKTKKYLFMHLPKTAGKLVTSLVEQQFPEEERCIFLFDDDLYVARKELTEQGNYDRCRFFAGHLSYEYIRLIKPNYIFTFIRDPVDRVLSQYFYWRQEGMNDKVADFDGNLRDLIDKNLTWEEDLISNFKKPYKSFKSIELLNLQTWQLAKNLYKREELSDQNVLNLAKQHLKDFNFVGVYERLKLDVALLFGEQGWELPTELPCVNPTKARKNSLEIDSAVIDAIRSANQLDIELYNQVVTQRSL